jgi:hypothetical protein
MVIRETEARRDSLAWALRVREVVLTYQRVLLGIELAQRGLLTSSRSLKNDLLVKGPGCPDGQLRGGGCS